MADSASDKLLRQMFETLPRESRIEFLREIVATLSETERARLVEEIGTTAPVPPPQAGARERPPVTRAVAPPAIEEDATPSEDHQQLIIDQKMKILMAQQGFENGGKAKMRRQVWSCMGLILLAGAVLVVLAYGSKELYDWLVGLLGPTAS